MKGAKFNGVGLLAGELPDGRPCVYRGGVVRIVHPHGQSDADMFTEFAALANAGVNALRVRSDCEPAESAPMEFSGCWDAVTGDVILMWRVPCVEIVTH